MQRLRTPSRPIFQLNTPKVELAINLKTAVTFIATSDRIKVLFVAVHEAGFGTFATVTLSLRSGLRLSMNRLRRLHSRTVAE